MCPQGQGVGCCSNDGAEPTGSSDDGYPHEAPLAHVEMFRNNRAGAVSSLTGHLV